MFKKLALLSVASLMVSTAAHAESTLLFTGASFTEDSYYAHLGGVTAFNGDLNKDGFLVRVTGAFGGYDYARTGSTNVDGDVLASDLLVGYQAFVGANRFTVYLGGDYQDHDLSPNDTANPVRGSEGGLKGQAEASLKLADKVKLDLIGSYSGAYDTYWSKAQLGCSFVGVSVGPELSFMGSESYDQQRYGLFVKDIPVGAASLGASAGYAHAARLGDSGAYGEVTASFAF